MKITEDGNHLLTTDSNNSKQTAKSSLYVSGDFGSASAVVTYQDDDGEFIPLTDGAVVSGEQYQISHGRNVSLYLTVVSSDTTTSINALLAPGLRS